MICNFTQSSGFLNVSFLLFAQLQHEVVFLFPYQSGLCIHISKRRGEKFRGGGENYQRDGEGGARTISVMTYA